MRLGRILTMAVAALFLAMVLLFHWRDQQLPILLDFTNFWATGGLALAGYPAGAYDPATLAAAQARAVGPTNLVMPFPYPPPFLLLVAPLALLDYHLAFAAWVALGLALFLWTGRRIAPLPLVAAQPAVLINGMIGQTGFLTGALLIEGTRQLEVRPWRAGLLLGLLVLKPQLALMLPVAVLAARAWPAVGGAAMSATGLMLLGAILLGPASYTEFFSMIGEFGGMLGGGRFTWAEFASPFALVRTIGLGLSAAWAVQISCAIFGAALVWRSWRHRWAQRVPILCTASLLGSPYLQSYDTLPMLVAIAWFHRRAPMASAALYLLCLLPLASQSDLVAWPNSISLAALLALILLWRERLSEGGDQMTPTLLPAASNMPRISLT